MMYQLRHWTTALLLSAVFCGCNEATAPTSGTIELNVVTIGTDLDADGFQLAIDDGSPQPLPANGTATWTGGAGSHTIAINGLAFNCDLTTNTPATSVTLGETTRVDVRVSCAPYLRNAIVYTSEAFGYPEVMVMRPDGSRRERLTVDQAVYSGPAVSPDGQTIAVTSRIGGAWNDIYTLDRFGKGRTKLVSASSAGAPVWSPDGTKLAFISERTGPNGAYARIFVVNRDGSGLRQLSPESVGYSYDFAAAWSQDGTRLVFSRGGILMVINADGTGMTSLGINGVYPAWSPDGSRIAYYWYANQITSIFVADENGANVRRLTSPVEGDQNPQWSPDGSQLVFARVEGGMFHLFKMAADGSGQTRLSVAPQSEFGARWSP